MAATGSVPLVARDSDDAMAVVIDGVEKRFGQVQALHR